MKKFNCILNGMDIIPHDHSEKTIECRFLFVNKKLAWNLSFFYEFSVSS